MLSYLNYRKFVSFKNGKQLLLRFLNTQDREGLLRLFQEASEEDIRFLRHDVKDMRIINYWIDYIDYTQVLPLLAIDFEKHCFVASATLHRGQPSAGHIGEIRLFVSEPFRGIELAGMMLAELIQLAAVKNLQWLKAEVVAERLEVIDTFCAQGFEVKAVLEDCFMHKDGRTHDVMLLMLPLANKKAGKRRSLAISEDRPDGRPSF
jgi:L-amino acid N-acyltransferase YncA